MNYGGGILNAIGGLLDLFEPHCADRSTLEELRTLLADRNRWREAHKLFSRIRRKTLTVEGGRDRLAESQYLFEEICAKTLYNLSGEPAPFDADSPFWLIPNALHFARLLKLDDGEIIRIVKPNTG